MSRTRNILMGFMILLAIGVSVVSARYFNFEPQALLLGKGELNSQLIYQLGFYGHISLGILALILGPWQFIPGIRNRNIALHRRIGVAYIVVCILSGLSGLYIAQYASTGIIARLGFSGLAIAWLLTTWLAYSSVRKKDIVSHQIWMIRSYALTFAAVTLRLYLGPSMALGASFDVAYPIISWVCWVPNLIAAELLFVRPIQMHQRPT